MHRNSRDARTKKRKVLHFSVVGSSRGLSNGLLWEVSGDFLFFLLLVVSKGIRIPSEISQYPYFVKSFVS